MVPVPEPWPESEREVRLDAKVASLAGSQEAVFSLAQCVALGLGARAVQKRAQTRRWHRIHRGVYSLVPEELLTREARFIAAVLACGPGAVLSHRSAAVVQGLLRDPPPRIDVTAPGHCRPHGIRVHRSLTLIPQDTTVVNGIPCTTIARTLLDLGDDLTQTEHERALNQADALGRLRLRALEDQLERNPTRRVAAQLRRALTIYRPGQAPTESRLEADFLALVEPTTCPTPNVRW
jgi:predicted transcriptional regulator of viral defense system